MPKTSGIAVKFFLSKRKGQSDATIFARIQKDGKAYPYYPGEKIPIKNWNVAKGRAKTGLRERDYINLNTRLDEVEAAMLGVFDKYEGQFTPVTFRDFVTSALNEAGAKEAFTISEFIEAYNADPAAAVGRLDELGGTSRAQLLEFVRALHENPALTNKALGKDNYVPSFIDFVAQYILEKKDKKGSNWDSVRALVRWHIHLSAFFHLEGESSYEGIANNFTWRDKYIDFLFTDQNFKFYYPKGRAFLEEMGTMKGKVFDKKDNYTYSKEPLSSSTVSKGISFVVEVLNAARRRSYASIETHKGFIPASGETNKVVMYFEEWEQLANADLKGNKTMENTRIRAFVGAFTGMRISDWDKMNRGMVKVFDGEKMLDVFTQKTGTPVAIPFLPVFEEMLEAVDYKIPPMANPVFNRNFKKLCKIAGINQLIEIVTTKGGSKKYVKTEKWQVVSSHLCRRSFASNFTLPPVNLPDTVAMLITGHADHKQFRKYKNHTGRLNAAKVSKSFQRQRAKWLYAIKEAG